MEQLAARYELVLVVVAIATAREGLRYHPAGLDLPTLVALVASGRPLPEHPGVVRWPTALEGLRAPDADVLIEPRRRRSK